MYSSETKNLGFKRSFEIYSNTYTQLTRSGRPVRSDICGKFVNLTGCKVVLDDWTVDECNNRFHLCVYFKNDELVQLIKRENLFYERYVFFFQHILYTSINSAYEQNRRRINFVLDELSKVAVFDVKFNRVYRTTPQLRITSASWKIAREIVRKAQTNEVFLLNPSSYELLLEQRNTNYEIVDLNYQTASSQPANNNGLANEINENRPLNSQSIRQSASQPVNQSYQALNRSVDEIIIVNNEHLNDQSNEPIDEILDLNNRSISQPANPSWQRINQERNQSTNEIIILDDDSNDDQSNNERSDEILDLNDRPTNSIVSDHELMDDSLDELLGTLGNFSPEIDLDLNRRPINQPVNFVPSSTLLQSTNDDLQTNNRFVARQYRKHQPVNVQSIYRPLNKPSSPLVNQRRTDHWIESFDKLVEDRRDYEISCKIVDLFPIRSTPFDLIYFSCAHCKLLDSVENQNLTLDLDHLKSASELFLVDDSTPGRKVVCPHCDRVEASLKFYIILLIEDRKADQMVALFEGEHAENYFDLEPIQVLADEEKQRIFEAKLNELRKRFNDDLSSTRPSSHMMINKIKNDYFIKNIYYDRRLVV